MQPVKQNFAFSISCGQETSLGAERHRMHVTQGRPGSRPILIHSVGRNMHQPQRILLQPGSHGQQLPVRAECQTVNRCSQVHEGMHRAAVIGQQWPIATLLCGVGGLLPVIDIDNTVAGARGVQTAVQ